MLQQNGALVVDEAITFAFDGDFTGAFREIPLRDGETIDEIGVSENGGRTATARPPSSARRRSRNVRHKAPVGPRADRLALRGAVGQRTFHIHYRLRGLAVAYDDVVDVNFRSGATSGSPGSRDSRRR